MNITAFVYSMVLGLILLFLGRSLFWVYLGLLGFLLGFEATQLSLAGEAQWVGVLVGLIVGVGAALVAVMFQYLAAGLAGFVGGAYVAVATLGTGTIGSGDLLMVILIGGVIGMLLFILLFDPALVVLTAVTGASLLLQPFELSPTVSIWAFLVLAAIGIVFQFIALNKSEMPGGQSASH